MSGIVVVARNKVTTISKNMVAQSTRRVAHHCNAITATGAIMAVVRVTGSRRAGMNAVELINIGGCPLS